MHLATLEAHHLRGLIAMAVAYNVNDAGQIIPFTPTEVAQMELQTYDIRQGGFPTHTRDSNGCTLKATYFCRYEYLERAICYMLGAAKSWDDSGDLKISRLIPQTWPGKPQIAAIRLDSATGHQFTQDNDAPDELLTPEYNYAKLAFTFQQLPYSLLEDDVTTDQIETYVQVMPSTSDISYLGLPGGTMAYNVEGGVWGPPPVGAIPFSKPIPYPLGFPVPTLTISRKWHRVPLDCWGPGTPLFQRVYGDVPTGKKPFAGTVNAETFLGFEPGYLLFLGTEEELEYDPLGDVLSWTLTHRWQAKTLAPHLWLYFFSSVASEAGSQGWYLATKRGADWSEISLLPDETGLFNVRQHALLFRTY
ncbi:MAG: hypothetical protein K8U57_31355 [Planctomycetes bacterium]|nr:hypothetical protein [Planctomycetota bacterium]